MSTQILTLKIIPPIKKYKTVSTISEIISGIILDMSIFIMSVLFNAEMAWVGVINPWIIIG